MFYKPKFCCSCGEEIERAHWGLFDSRRFCQLCETQHKVYDLIPRALVALGILTGILGFGFYLLKPENSASFAPQRIVENNRPANKNSSVQTNLPQVSTNRSVQESAREQDSAALPQNRRQIAFAKPVLPQAQPAQIEKTKVSAEEKFYFCGAQTKKGTPCSRRVKGGGRCWQHAGQPAMLPAEKLIAGN